MYTNRHSGPPNPTQGPPMTQGQFGSVPPNSNSVVREFCDKINKEYEALQSANHSLRIELEKVNNEKAELHKLYVMYSEMSYGLHIDINRQKEISKRLNNIIINLMPYVSSDQQAQIASSVDRAKQVSPEELNSIMDQNMRENYGAPELHPSMAGAAGIPGLGRLLPGGPGMPGMQGMPPHGPLPPLPPNLPNLPPHGLPSHAPPMHGLPPQSMMQPGLNMSSPPNAAGLLAMSGGPGMPGLGVPGLHGGLIPPVQGRTNPIPPMETNNNNNNNINNNHNKRNSIDNDRRAPSGSSESNSKKSRKHENESSSHANQHQVMMNNSSSISDDEKSEDLVVDGNDDRITSPRSHHNGSASPRENGGSNDWNDKQIKKERPLSRASSVTSGPSGRERSSPKTSANKLKSSPTSGPDPMGTVGPSAISMMPGYGRSIFPMGPVGPDGLPIPVGPSGVKIPLGPLPEPYSIQLDSEGRPKLVPCSPRALADPGVPKKAREVFTLEHGEVVCAVALSNPTRNIYTGGKSLVKVWSLDNSESNSEVRAMKTLYTPVAELDCLPSNSYVRACKLLPDGKKLIVGGEVPPISVWDLGSSGPVKLGVLKELAPACYALAISPDSKTCITCFSDGTIGLYDIHNLSLIGKFQGHADGASCIDISNDGNTFWTGGLDMSLKSWSLNGKIVGEKDFISKTNFNSQLFSLGCCPSGDYIAVGMENSIIDVMSTSNKSENKQLKMHDSCVLALKFAASGKWFISTGKDKLLNLCGSPAINFPQIIKFQENSSVLSCDISRDDKYFATGSGDKKATVYEVLY